MADSYHYSQRIHLNHFGDLAGRPCNEVTDEHVKRFFEHRLKVRHSETIKKEWITLLSFYAWLEARFSEVRDRSGHAFAQPCGESQGISLSPSSDWPRRPSWHRSSCFPPPGTSSSH